MFKLIEIITGHMAAFFYRHGWDRIANPVSRLSWRVYDRCPVGYKGKL